MHLSIHPSLPLHRAIRLHMAFSLASGLPSSFLEHRPFRGFFRSGTAFRLLTSRAQKFQARQVLNLRHPTNIAPRLLLHHLLPSCRQRKRPVLRRHTATILVDAALSVAIMVQVRSSLRVNVSGTLWHETHVCLQNRIPFPALSLDKCLRPPLRSRTKRIMATRLTGLHRLLPLLQVDESYPVRARLHAAAAFLSRRS